MLESVKSGLKQHPKLVIVITSVLTIILSYLLINPIGGFMFTSGASMEPTYPDGCGIITVDEWNGNLELEDEIIVFNPNYLNHTGNVAGYDYEINHYVIHRVIKEYENYNPNTAKYKVTDEGKFKFEDEHGSISYKNTTQPPNEMKQLNGEHVVITMGDGNEEPDPEIIPVDNIEGITPEDGYNRIPCPI